MVDPHLLYRDIQLYSSVPEFILPPHPLNTGIKLLVVEGDACHTEHSAASHIALCLFSTSSKRLSLGPVDLSSCGTLSDASNLFFISQLLGAPRWLCRIRWTQPFVRLFTAAHQLSTALTLFVCFSFFGRGTITNSFCRCRCTRCVSDRLEGSQLMLFFVCLFVSFKEYRRKFS